MFLDLKVSECVLILINSHVAQNNNILEMIEQIKRIMTMQGLYLGLILEVSEPYVQCSASLKELKTGLSEPALRQNTQSIPQTIWVFA